MLGFGMGLKKKSRAFVNYGAATDDMLVAMPEALSFDADLIETP